MKNTKQKKHAPEPEARRDEILSISSFWKAYTASSSPRVRIIDLFIVYLLALISSQFFYRFVVGDDFPRNAFVSGVFCPLGVIVLLVVLRSRGLQFRQLAEFFLASIVLFVASINFAGWMIFHSPYKILYLAFTYF